IRRIETRADQGRRIKPPRQQRQGSFLEWPLQAGDVVLCAERIGVWAPFLYGMHQAIDANTIVEQSSAAANHHAAIVGGLPCETDARGKIAERHVILA